MGKLLTKQLKLHPVSCQVCSDQRPRVSAIHTLPELALPYFHQQYEAHLRYLSVYILMETDPGAI